MCFCREELAEHGNNTLSGVHITLIAHAKNLCIHAILRPKAANKWHTQQKQQ